MVTLIERRIERTHKTEQGTYETVRETDFVPSISKCLNAIAAVHSTDRELFPRIVAWLEPGALEELRGDQRYLDQRYFCKEDYIKCYLPGLAMTCLKKSATDRGDIPNGNILLLLGEEPPSPAWREAIEDQHRTIYALRTGKIVVQREGASL